MDVVRIGDGTYRVLENLGRTLSPLGIDDGVVAFGRDITERRAAEEALRRREIEAARTEELRASRARIVEAADAARRRIERDLHDGAQQQLVALAIELRTARSRLERDPRAAGELLDAAAGDLEAAIRDLRELARGIHPAVLSDRGLVAALEGLAGRIPLPVEIASVPEGRLPESVEAAVYFVVAEAITNVARYARASHARVSVARAGQRVVVEVADDGVGGADAANGSGLRGLVDRVAALDGRFDVESPPGGGTTVRAVIPLPAAAAGSAPQSAARFASRGVRREAETSGT